MIFLFIRPFTDHILEKVNVRREIRNPVSYRAQLHYMV